MHKKVIGFALFALVSGSVQAGDGACTDRSWNKVINYGNNIRKDVRESLDEWKKLSDHTVDISFVHYKYSSQILAPLWGEEKPELRDYLPGVQAHMNKHMKQADEQIALLENAHHRFGQEIKAWRVIMEDCLDSDQTRDFNRSRGNLQDVVSLRSDVKEYIGWFEDLKAKYQKELDHVAESKAIYQKSQTTKQN